MKILEKNHHTVTVANNGLEAVEHVKKKRFDVVLMGKLPYDQYTNPSMLMIV